MQYLYVSTITEGIIFLKADQFFQKMGNFKYSGKNVLRLTNFLK